MARRTRESSCTGKVAHPDKAAALGAIAGLARRGALPTMLTAYRCRFCSSWHVGNERQRVKGRRR